MRRPSVVVVVVVDVVVLILDTRSKISQDIPERHRAGGLTVSKKRFWIDAVCHAQSPTGALFDVNTKSKLLHHRELVPATRGVAGVLKSR
jgi:hypothetical protein